MDGPDHRASLEPNELAALVRGVRTVERALGDGVKRPTAAEQETKKVVRRRLLTARALGQGAEISSADVVLRRAGHGLPAEELPCVLGRRLRVALPAGAAVEREHL